MDVSNYKQIIKAFLYVVSTLWKEANKTIIYYQILLSLNINKKKLSLSTRIYETCKETMMSFLELSWFTICY